MGQALEQAVSSGEEAAGTPKSKQGSIHVQPAFLQEDPNYSAIRDDLNRKWLERTGEEPLSAEHQNYLFGDPTNPRVLTLVQETESLFRERYPLEAATYDEVERVRAYDDIGDDPAWRAMQTNIDTRTNTDSQVRSGKGGRGIWERVNIREGLHARLDFAREYPEKAKAYTKRWDTFVSEHPEIAEMNNAQWGAWCDTHPGTYVLMSEPRNIARAASHVAKTAEIAKTQSRVQRQEKELMRIHENLGILIEHGEQEDTQLARDKKMLGSLQLEDVVSSVRTNIPAEIQSADTEVLSEMQKELAELPYMPSDITREMDHEGVDEGVTMVDTDAIVGSISPAFQNWSTEYSSRKGRHVEVARQLIKGTPESVDYVFHVKDPKHGIKLKKISGPDGDLFFAIDGSHRVASCKLIRLPQLPAHVENVTNVSEMRTTDPILKSDWEKRISLGLIRGSVVETNTTSGSKSFSLKIDSQVLPWMSLPQGKFIKMTQFYFKRYPNSLDKMVSLTTGKKIPKEAFLDMTAMNFYLAGRWREYKPKQTVF